MENKDIKELNKHQLILVTLLITFVVSIATGIVTVSLMNQAPKSVPYTVNNVIQRTIEKVTTVSEDAKVIDSVIENKGKDTVSMIEGDILVKVYSNFSNEEKLLGEGVLVSDVGLILVDNSIIDKGEDNYLVELGDVKFNSIVLKKFENGFIILKIVNESKNNNSSDNEDKKIDDKKELDSNIEAPQEKEEN
jgi:hypothetical protein